MYHARALNSPALPSLSEIGTAQANPTEHTLDATTRLLNYCATYPNPTLRFVASDMILRVFSDASYLSVSKCRSRAAGYFYLSSGMPADSDTSTFKPSTTTKLTPNHDPSPPWNGAIHILCQILSNVMSSATEAEISAVFANCKKCLAIRQALVEMGHPQPATPIEVDNQCAVGILTDAVKQRRAKAMDMRFFWVKDRIRQGQLFLYWRPGKDNRADYSTKHHSPSNHKEIRTLYFHNSLHHCSQNNTRRRFHAVFYPEIVVRI